jgi:hypothetical protein
MEEINQMCRLPQVVIIQKIRKDSHEDEKAYLVGNEKWEEYVRIAGNDHFTPAEIKEEAAKKLGYRIDVKAFEDSTACQLSCMHFPNGSAYSIYATEFQSKPRKIITENAD